MPGTLNMAELRKLNFEELISVGVPDVASYTFDEYRSNGPRHTPIDGYCTSCDEQGCNCAKDDKSYQLTNISHGAHSSDFFLALQDKDKPDTTNWHQQPVLFVYESPGGDYGIYGKDKDDKEVRYKGYSKHPSKEWYWIRDMQYDQQRISYPKNFCGGRKYGYAAFILSAIHTFKLANVYVTNLVKCGLNNSEGKFKRLSSYEDKTVENCYSKFLEREIAILQPRIVFAVSSAVERWLRRFGKHSYYLQQLPHPAGRRRGEHYRAIYFWAVARALHKVGIIDTEEGSDLARMYLEKYDAIKA